MNPRLFLLIFSIITLAGVVFASCANPDINIIVPNKLWYEDAKFDMNLVFSSDPGPSTLCPCPMGQDCGMKWQMLKDSNSTWITIPSVGSSDLNCSGTSCSTRNSYPNEDVPFNHKITCVDQKVYQLRGYQPFTGATSATVSVYCYPSLACTPPATGDFDLNATCHYRSVPLVIGGNYSILSSGKAFHSDSNVIFRSTAISDPAPPQFLIIHNGGLIDLNQSMLMAGLNGSFEFGGVLIVSLLLAVGFTSLFYRRQFIEVFG